MWTFIGRKSNMKINVVNIRSPFFAEFLGDFLLNKRDFFCFFYNEFLTLFGPASGMTFLTGGGGGGGGWGALWPGSSFDVIALRNDLKQPDICFHMKIQVFSFP